MAKKQVAIGDHCVACGCCVRRCPKSALSIPKGVAVEVNPAACIGCGLCVSACPAGILSVAERSKLDEA